MTDPDPMLGPPEERESYMRKIMKQVEAEMEKDRAALRTPQGVADVGHPVLLGGKGMQNGIVSSVS